MKKRDFPAYRRRFGVLMGGILGLSYGLASQTINHWVLPGVPFYQPPFGAWGNILLWTLIGMVLGTAAAWAEESLAGVFFSSLLGALMVGIATMLTGRTDAEALPVKGFTVFLILGPIIGFLIPFLAVFRWMVNNDVIRHYDREPFWKHLWFPLGLVLVSMAAGIALMYPRYARVEISRMNTMLQEGLRAKDASTLPAPLQDEDVGNFKGLARGRYTLQFDIQQLNRFAIPRAISTRAGEDAALIARFESGWVLVCIFPQSDGEPSCKGFGAGGPG